jgi:hypothetical protein
MIYMYCILNIIKFFKKLCYTGTLAKCVLGSCVSNL